MGKKHKAMVLKTISKNSIVRVLVVDDHPNTATTMARAISQLGPEIEALSAESGQEALQLVDEHPIDLLITDMVMPGVSGLELIELMQSHPGGRPAYMALMTAYDVPGLKTTAQRLKVNDVINKPVRLERICQIVSKAIEDLGRAPGSQPVPAKPQLKILVADDVQDNVSLLTRYLGNEGYLCLGASNGIEALAKTRAEMPDLVLLDVSMPVMDGFEALQQIRSDLTIGHIPVIILTAAKIEPMDMQYALSLGADDYVTKPFDRRELMARIHTRLRVKEAEDLIRRRNKELNLLPEIGRELSGRLDFEELIDVVLRKTVETLGAFSGHILLQTSKGSFQKNYYFPSANATSCPAEPPALQSLLQHIQENRHGFIVQDTLRENGWQEFSSNSARSLVVVPMFGRHTLLGLLVLAHEQAGYFAQEHKLLLQAIASQASIAIENAQLSTGMETERQFMTAILQNSEDAILLFSAEHRLSQINPAAMDLFSNHEIKLDQPLPEGDEFDQIRTLLEIAGSIHNTTSGQIIWPDTRLFTVFVSPIGEGGYAVFLHNSSASPSGEDINNDFIAKTTHDLKNPLTFIKLAGQMLSKAGSLNEKQMEIVQGIGKSVQTMDGLVLNMLEMARLGKTGQESAFEEVDVNDLVADITDEYLLQAEARKQIFQLDRTDIPTIVSTDPNQLRHALRNLAENALLYCPAGGAISLSVENTGTEAIIRMKDNGYGIPKEDLPFIFNRFYRGHNKEVEDVRGSGLGLSIVKEIVDRLNARIEVESDYGKGSCFRVVMPLTGQKKSSSDPTQDRAKGIVE
jgi:signal transduction histidine kinase/DNA-binding response OmpR family regulator